MAQRRRAHVGRMYGERGAWLRGVGRMYGIGEEGQARKGCSQERARPIHAPWAHLRMGTPARQVLVGPRAWALTPGPALEMVHPLAHALAPILAPAALQ